MTMTPLDPRMPHAAVLAGSFKISIDAMSDRLIAPRLLALPSARPLTPNSSAPSPPMPRASSIPGMTALFITLSLGVVREARAQNRAVYLDDHGVIRWQQDRKEVTLFGANYVLTTASDYRAAGYVHGDRKRMIDE